MLQSINIFIANSQLSIIIYYTAKNRAPKFYAGLLQILCWEPGRLPSFKVSGDPCSGDAVSENTFSSVIVPLHQRWVGIEQCLRYIVKTHMEHAIQYDEDNDDDDDDHHYYNHDYDHDDDNGDITKKCPNVQYYMLTRRSQDIANVTKTLLFLEPNKLFFPRGNPSYA